MNLLSAGLWPLDMVDPESFLVAAGLVGVLFVIFVNPIGSLTSREYESKMNEVFGNKQQKLSVSTDGIWLRDTHAEGQFIIHGDMLDVSVAQIINPIVYRFDAEGPAAADQGQQHGTDRWRLGDQQRDNLAE